MNRPDPRYVPTIGLEVHVQLKTRSKMFCACPVEFGAEPNTHTCPVCLGFPGALPVMNEEALKMTALTGLMLGCEIAGHLQIRPEELFLSGHAEELPDHAIRSADLPRRRRAAARLCLSEGRAEEHRATRQESCGSRAFISRRTSPRARTSRRSSGIDFNRAGTPLMEIVSEPDIDSPEEAFAYLTALQQILIYGGVSDADMEKGQLRCDCNVSVRRRGRRNSARRSRSRT